MSQDVKVLIAIGVMTLAILLAGLWVLSNQEGKNRSEIVLDNSLLVGGDDYYIGTDSAKITLAEFADLQCPACRVGNQTVKDVLAAYPNDVKIVFRHFTLPQHTKASLAAQAAEAAGEQGKFWEMVDLLYKQQSEWNEGDEKKLFSQYAKQLNLDETLFNQSLESDKFLDRIQKDKNNGISVGVNSTPTFFLNGRKLESFSYGDIKTEIDQILNK